MSTNSSINVGFGVDYITGRIKNTPSLYSTKACNKIWSYFIVIALIKSGVCYEGQHPIYTLQYILCTFTWCFIGKVRF